MPDSSSPDDAVLLDGVTKNFGQVAALQKVWLSIRRGELMTLLGPSGCGKTTLLNLVAGFFSPDGGRILIDGRLVNDLPTHRREIGMMFQNYALFPHMSVANNVAYGLKMRGVGRKEIARRVADALALVRLTGLEDRRPRQLSGGQQQRVAIARALVINPKVLLLDEPFSALDRNLRGSMQVEIREIQRKIGVTTIFVTHDQGEALSMSDRIAVMSEGTICQVGTPEEIYRRPNDRYVASFVGDTNVFRAKLARVGEATCAVRVGDTEIEVPRGPIAPLGPGAEVDLFVRPEHLRIAEPGEPAAITGTVSVPVYQGGHVDLYVDGKNSLSGPLLARLPGHDAMTRWPAGTTLGLVPTGADAIAFPPVGG